MTLYAAYTRNRNLVTVTDSANSIPSDVSRVALFETKTPETTAMQLCFSALAYGLDYDLQLVGEQVHGGVR